MVFLDFETVNFPENVQFYIRYITNARSAAAIPESEFAVLKVHVDDTN